MFGQVPKLKEIAKDGIDFAASRKEKKGQNNQTTTDAGVVGVESAIVSAANAGWRSGHGSALDVQSVLPASGSAGDTQIEELDLTANGNL